MIKTPIGATLILTVLSALTAPPAYGQASAFHILLTNDDGVGSPGLQVLAKELAGVGTVHVVAPCGERSGSSMAVALRDELELRSVEVDGEPLGHCVDTTPAGAVMLAITSLAPEGGFDLVVSGINRGANVGTVAHMSGTVGGAMMGAFYGVPAIAASLGARSPDFDYSARFVSGFAEELKRRPAMPGVVFSINVPQAAEKDIAGVVVAEMGGSQLRIAYEEVEAGAGERRFRPRISLATEAPENSDTEAFLGDMISITPLQFDWTAHEVVEQLRAWQLRPSIGR